MTDLLGFKRAGFGLPTLCGAALLSALALASVSTGEPVRVKYAEGLVHGFLVLRDLDGSLLANGDLLQVARGDRVTSRLRFRFKDGSLHDETTVFSQRGHFRLISDHLVQKGPSFPQPLDMQLNAGGNVTVRYTNKDGEAKQESEHLELPADVANGLIPVLLKNVAPAEPPAAFAFVAATPKPRLVKLAIASAGEERFTIGGEARTATRYVLKVELGGLTGLLAPLVGKQPPDSYVWILHGEAPAFLRAEQPFYSDGPVWRVELASPAWSRPTTTERSLPNALRQR
jgi:hypothetical protein